MLRVKNMSTEPLIKNRNAIAGLYGASASCLVFVLLLIYVAFSSVVPGDDASIRGAAILLGAAPPLWAVLFLYFMGISFKESRRLKFALITQSIWIAVLSGLLSYVALAHEGWSVALPVFAVSFGIGWVIIGIGSWCSTLAK